jgi:hypothetical protein
LVWCGVVWCGVCEMLGVVVWEVGTVGGGECSGVGLGWGTAGWGLCLVWCEGWCEG